VTVVVGRLRLVPAAMQQRVLQRHVVHHADREDRVVVLVRHRAGQGISANAVHVAGGALPRQLDHLRGAIESIDPLGALSEPSSECSGAAADVQRPPARLWHLPEQQPVVERVVIPIEHSQTLQARKRIAPTARGSRFTVTGTGQFKRVAT
jgi:hypothetical protein